MQLLCNTSVKANSLNANTTVQVRPLGSLYMHDMPERSDYGCAASNIIATIGTINELSATDIPEKYLICCHFWLLFSLI